MNEPILTPDQIEYLKYKFINYYIIILLVILQQFVYMLENIKIFMININIVLKLVNRVWSRINYIH